MSSFTVIPIEDIHLFLSSNNTPIPINSDDSYIAAWNLIQNNQGNLIAPPSISDWIIAYNLSTQGTQFPSTKTTEIILTPDNELLNLSRDLGLENINKERILRILNYLGVLVDDSLVYNDIPDELLGLIFRNLDCKTIELMCKTSYRVNNFCQSRAFKNMIQQRSKLPINQDNYDAIMKSCKMGEVSKNISVGGSHSLLLTLNGYVYSFGSNLFGQLGLGDNNNRNIPTLIPNLNNSISISSNGSHSLVLTSTGQVYSFGYNAFGQLGLGDNDSRNVPTLIPNLNNIISISQSESYSLALDASGHIYSFGQNVFGQLGLGDNNDRNIPTLIPNLDNIAQISGDGGKHSLALTSTGQVYSFGDNNSGKLGLGDEVNRNIPTLIPNLNNIVSISAGGSYSLVLDSFGRVYSFGNNSWGQLGLGSGIGNYRNIPTLIPNLDNIIQISAGASHSLLLNSSGYVYGFGFNSFGNLGLGHRTSVNIPTLIPNLNNIVQISTSTINSMVLKSTGEVYIFKLYSNTTLDIPTLIPNINLFQQQ